MTDYRDPQMNRNGYPRDRNNMGMWIGGIVVLLLIVGGLFYYNSNGTVRSADNSMNRSASTTTTPSTNTPAPAPASPSAPGGTSAPAR